MKVVLVNRKMDIKYFLVFLVVCQCSRESELRPTNLSDGFKLIQPFSTEMNITLNGTMQTSTNSLFLSLSDKDNKSVCNVTYDVSAKTATMQSELSEPDSMVYEAEHNPIAPTRFWLEIEPSIRIQQKLVQLHLEIGDAGPLTFEACKISDFDNIHRIVVEGAQSVTSLLFKFSP